MSQERLNEFISQVLASEELQQDLQSCEDKDSLILRILEISSGITVDDIENALEQKRQDLGAESIRFPIVDIRSQETLAY